MRLIYDQRGSYYIGLLLGLPVLVIMLSGAFVYGRGMVDWFTLVQAQRAGVQRMQIAGYYDAVADQKVSSVLQAHGIDPAAVGVEATTTPQSYGAVVYLKLTYVYQPHFLGVALPPLTLQASSSAVTQNLPPP